MLSADLPKTKDCHSVSELKELLKLSTILTGIIDFLLLLIFYRFKYNIIVLIRQRF